MPTVYDHDKRLVSPALDAQGPVATYEYSEPESISNPAANKHSPSPVTANEYVKLAELW